MAADRKVRLVATDSQKYGSRQLRPGDEFEADQADVPDILALGIASEVADVPRGVPLSVKQATKRPAKAEKPKRKYVRSGKYKRRDMRAED